MQPNEGDFCLKGYHAFIPIIFCLLNTSITGRIDTQHNDTQYSNTQHNDTQYNNTQYNSTQRSIFNCDTQQTRQPQHYVTLCCVKYFSCNVDCLYAECYQAECYYADCFLRKRLLPRINQIYYSRALQLVSTSYNRHKIIYLEIIYES